jgi:ribosomal protein L29
MTEQIRELKRQIYNLECALPYMESVIAHLEKGQGVEIYNNRPPCVFEAHERQERRQRENYPPEIYLKSGEETLAELKVNLENRKKEIADLRAKLAKCNND